MEEADRKELAKAKMLLENPSFAMRVADFLGKPMEWALARLPERGQALVASAANAALGKALQLALTTMGGEAHSTVRDWSHRASVWLTGAAGGFFGLAGLPIELPVTTTLMLRSIADHARAQGEDLTSPGARMECLTVFALGGKNPEDDAAETGYYAVRTVLARAVTEAVEYLAGRVAGEQAVQRSAPVLVRLVSMVAARFTIQVEDKVALQLVPAIGAVTGAGVNDLFMNHFQRIAWGHFTVRRLERKYGIDEVRSEYERLPKDAVRAHASA